MPADQTSFEIDAFLPTWLRKLPQLRQAQDVSDAQKLAKVFPVFVPASELLPAVTYSRVNTKRDYTMQGQQDPTVPTFKLVCWAKSDEAGYAINLASARAIRDSLSGLQTAVADSVGNKHYVRRVILADEFDDDDAPIFADGVEVFQRVLMLQVSHTETVRNLIGGS